MSVLGWMVGGAGAALGSASAALYGVTVKAQSPRRVPNGTAPPVPHEAVEWTSGGKRIAGWYMKQQDTASREASPGAPVIIVAHGWGSNRTRVLRYALPLREAGYSILMYDARGHGDSDPFKTPNGLQFRDDLRSALEWLRGRPEVDPGRIGVLGHSLGAFGAVLAIDDKAPIAALVADSMPVRFRAMVEAELRRKKLPLFPLAQLLPPFMIWRSGIPRAVMKRADPSLILADNHKHGRTPVLLVHSLKDGFIPPFELHHVLARTPGLPYLLVDAPGHSASEQDPAFWPTVKEFFHNQLRIKKGG